MSTLSDQFRCGVFIGPSRAMHEIYEVVERVCNLPCTVLILGESGTGKELVARTIHNWGLRRSHPFVPIDCSAVTLSLFEVEMFGCARGAYTGADRDRCGLFETANGGTLFLDEVGNLPLELQSKLLRVLQEREVRPVGGNRTKPSTGRILAATNEDVERSVGEGRFRADLFYRLNVVRLTVPPLRRRRGDIRPLANEFVRAYSTEIGVQRTISDRAIECLEAYDWPGNVRELQNAAAQAVALEEGPLLDFHHFQPLIQHPLDGGHPETLASMKRRAYLRAMQLTGNKKLAARMLGVGKTTFYRRMKEYDIERKASMQQFSHD